MKGAVALKSSVSLEKLKRDKARLKRNFSRYDVRSIPPKSLHRIPVALVQPLMPDGSYLPNLGIMYLASLLLVEGYQVKIFDENLESNFLTRLLEFAPQLVGFTCVTANVNRAGRLAGEIKQKLPGVVTVAGGPHPTALPNETLSLQKNFDYLFAGEAERSFIHFCNLVLRDKKTRIDELLHIPGLSFRDPKDMVISNRAGAFLEGGELDDLPFPAWHLLPLEDIFKQVSHGLFSRGKRIMPVMTTRGCPNYCGFCCRVMGFKFRKNDVEKVLTEVLWLYENFQVDEIYFEDDTFTQEPERAHELLDGIIDLNLPIYIKFSNGLRADKVDRPLLEKMMAAGVYWVGFGIESGSTHTQTLMKKFLDLDLAFQNVQLAKSMGFKVGANCIIGYPGETKQSIKESLDYFIRLGLDSCAVVNCVPFPGTTAWQVCKQNNWFTERANNYDNYWFEIFKVSPLIETNTLKAKDLSRAIFFAYIRIYLLNGRRFFTVLRAIFIQHLSVFRSKWMRLLRANSSMDR